MGSYVQIDLPGMSPCILTLSPQDCTNGGATYLFWIKPLDDEQGVIFSTVKEQRTEGITVRILSSKKLFYTINQANVASNIFAGETENNFEHTDWVHMSLVKFNDNSTMKIFESGTEVSVSVVPETDMTINREPPIGLALGKTFVASGSGMETKNMILDELVLCDKPLTKQDINSHINL